MSKYVYLLLLLLFIYLFVIMDDIVMQMRKTNRGNGYCFVTCISLEF